MDSLKSPKVTATPRSSSNLSDSASNTAAKSTEAYYKNHIDKSMKENKQLKQKLQMLERENRSLKKSLYELSIKYDHLSQQKHPEPFDIDSIDGTLSWDTPEEESISPEEPSRESGGERDRERDDSDKLRFSRRDSQPTDRGTVQILMDRGRSGVKGGEGGWVCSHTLKGHTGAIHALQFSPCGRFLASGSFDRSVRVWDWTTQQTIVSLEEHDLNVAEVSWTLDSSSLISGSYDQTVRVWSVARGKLLSTHPLQGFVQTVMCHPEDPHICFAGTTHREIVRIDTREGKGEHWETPAMVNSLHVYRNGMYLLAGDSEGCLKIWDLRKGKPVFSQAISPGRSKPISHVTVSRGRTTEEEGLFLGVNSYDNVLRVYDRGASPKGSVRPLQLIHSLTGHRNAHWPIKNHLSLPGDSTDLDELELEGVTGQRTHGNDPSAESSLLLATGSADPHVYIFDATPGKSGGSLWQRLEGHKDHVFAVHFHPSEPLLASCSADGSIKLWQPPSLY